MNLKLRSLILTFASFGGFHALGAPPELTREDLPRIPPVEITNVQSTFQIKKGFQLQLAAAEPLVVDPIEISFDENGRMFVVEMRDYSEMREVTPHMGQIRMLEDTNDDGVFDKSTVYTEDLPWPTGVLCYDGGIFVAATPEILYFKDTDGDGKADTRKVVFTGYGTGKDRLNVQALVNCLRWGLDNRIHGQTAPNGGMVKRPDAPDATAISLQGRDFNFDPRKFDLQPENGGGQYGMSYDNYGRKFACSNSRHIMTFMYDAKYAECNPFYNMPAPLVDIPKDGPAAEVYRTSPEEAWRVIRTKWRVTGIATGPIEGGGRASGYFTGATGVSIYRGDAWPEDYVDDAFTADIGSNLIHHKKIREKGVELVAERAPDEQKVEFLTSTDLWFRPAQMANAPDGCLYICDMYREVIEHPWSLPENIKKLLDLNSGNDRGRIYRIAPEGFKPRPTPKLAKASTKELVATLEHKNGWHRDTAARLLFERQDKSAVPLLENLVKKSRAPLARMHALYALDGLGALKPSHIQTALADNDAFVREHGVKLSEKFVTTADNKLWNELRQLRNDPAARVRYQLAFTLGQFNRPGKIEGLVAIAERDFASPWLQAAILSSLADSAGEMFAALASDSRLRENKAGQDFLRQLVVLVGAKNGREEVADVLSFIGKAEDPALVFGMTDALGDGMQRTKHSLTSIGDSVKPIFIRAGKVALDSNAPESQRVPAIGLLAHTSYADCGPSLLTLLDLKQPQPVQLAALSTLSQFNEPQLATQVIERWDAFSPRVRSDALTFLLARPERATTLLRAIESGTIRATALDSTQVKFLRNHKDKGVHQLATKVLATKPTGTRQQVIDSFTPALTLKGESALGKKTYQERCNSCHRLAGEGYTLGPDLVTVKTAGKEKIMMNILDPNAEVRPEYISYLIETKDDNTLVGVVVNETASSVTLRQAFGKEDVIPRDKISSMKSQGSSIMPEGLESGLTPQDMANLLEFITTANQ